MSPRKRAGAAGAGLPGVPSSNRTDLAISTPTGLPYGEAGALAAAQQAVPIGPGAQPPPPPAAAGAGPPPPIAEPGVPGGSNPPPGALQALLQAAQGMPPPSGPGFSAPTQRPNEHVMTGSPLGPGPGPEILGLNQPPTPLVMTLQAAAQTTHSGLLANLAAQASSGPQ